MDLMPIAIPLILVALYFLGTSLINNYFDRKEKFVDKLQEKMKGSFDGTGE